MARPKIVYPRPPSLPRQELPPTLVKSAARVLQLLEFFDDIKRPATVVEITETLKYPQSSVCDLLETLVALGYLCCNPRTHHYQPSSRVALMGHWVNDNFTTDGSILCMMSEINRRTGQGVVLATRRGLFSHYIHVVQAMVDAGLHITLGAQFPLVTLGSGFTLLSTYPDAEIRKIAYRSNAEAPAGAAPVQISALMETVSQVRRQGYCFTTGVILPNRGSLFFPLPVECGEQPMAVGVVGPADTLTSQREDLVSVLREQLDRLRLKSCV